jgi:predicted unusual protein kinase regulating ubiquinone biosynthesis (AarF/ABC1/UbiB family)
MSNEDNRLSARAARYARVGGQVGGIAARVAGQRVFGLGAGDDAKNAAALARALGGLKGPLMKVAQLLSTIPEALPAEYARELAQLQADAPPMGPGFVKRRMMAELGPDWRSKFASFETAAASSASLGQVHRATHHDGSALACKLQYPDMQSAVEADLNQLKLIFSIHGRMNPAVDTSEMLREIASRLREELDYRREAKHVALYDLILADVPEVRPPDVYPELSSARLLTMGWLDGARLMTYKEAPLEDRNRIGRALFKAWWYPFAHYGVIHGDPHLGNYTIFSEDGSPTGVNLLDYGCIRTFRPEFVAGVIDLYNGLLENDRDRVVHAYEAWGFQGLNDELIDAMSIWARFIYGPLLDDRVRTIADEVAPGDYGRKEAFAVHKVLKEKGPVRIPREFVFMDRAAIGLGGVFLHLDAKQNWYRLFNEQIANFDTATVAARQAQAFGEVDLPLPT